MLDKVNIFITKFDLERLKNLLDKKLRLDDYDHALLTELKKAQVVEPELIPGDVITMNSKIRLKEENGDSWDCTLVFPEDADIEEDKISILSPIGCSIIGYKVGSTISFPTPKGDKQVSVEDILHQPERSGDMNI